jgi:adenylylsulfate kinase-like enzyme
MIVLFCGIPGSGKSTIAEELAARAAELGALQLLSSDKLKPPVYRKMFRALAPERRLADLVILDATFFSKELRQQLKALVAPEQVVTVYLQCPLAVALERNRAREPRIAEKAVHIVHHRLQPPAHSSLTIDTTAATPKQAADTIFDLLKQQLSSPGEID